MWARLNGCIVLLIPVHFGLVTLDLLVFFLDSSQWFMPSWWLEICQNYNKLVIYGKPTHWNNVCLWCTWSAIISHQFLNSFTARYFSFDNKIQGFLSHSIQIPNATRFFFMRWCDILTSVFFQGIPFVRFGANLLNCWNRDKHKSFAFIFNEYIAINKICIWKHEWHHLVRLVECIVRDILTGFLI